MVHLATSLRRTLETIAPTNTVARRLLDGDVKEGGIDYLAHRGELLSYLPKGKEHKTTETGAWAREGRQEGRPGRVVRGLVNDSGLTDKDFEDFANFVKARGIVESEDNGFEFRLVSGDDVRAWYHQNRYNYNTGQLASSCMRYDRCQEFFGIYTANPEKVSLLILVDKSEKLVGRALIWQLDDGRIYMDRQYGTDTTIRMFKDYAEDRGWQCYGSGWQELSVTLPKARHTYYPYMDSLPYLTLHDDGSGTLSSKSFDNTYDADSHYSLSSTDGGPIHYLDDDDDDDDDYFYCQYCDEREHLDYSYEQNGYYYCESCYDVVAEEVCEDCGNSFRRSGMHYAGEDRWHNPLYRCEDCQNYLDTHSECGGCGEMTHHDDLDGDLCSVCYAERWAECARCGCEEHREDLDEIGNCIHCQRDLAIETSDELVAA